MDFETRIGRVNGLGRIVTDSASRTGTQTIDRAAPHQHHQPRSDRSAAAIKRSRLTPGLPKDVRSNLLSVGAVTEHPLGHAGERMPKALIQYAQGFLVAAGDGTYYRLVSWRN